MNMPNGYTMLGHAYRDGFGKQQSYEEAARYYSLAARNGDPEGIYNLASYTIEMTPHNILTKFI
jgi:TPR repeat protein